VPRGAPPWRVLADGPFDGLAEPGAGSRRCDGPSCLRNPSEESIMSPSHLKTSTLAAALALALGASPTHAQTTTVAPAPTQGPATARPVAPPVTPAARRADADDRRDSAQDAVQHVNKALEVVRKMEGDPNVKSLLKSAKGVFVVPDYGRAALVVGGQGGAGVLLVHRGGKWTGPAFYNMGGMSLGAQAGISAGQIAMILMDDKALASFGTNNKFSLNADAGLTIVNYSARAHGTAGRGDIVMWSDTEGAFANLSVSVTDVNYDENETRAYYDRTVDPKSVVAGDVASQKADKLLKALPG
jgi:lipid-binding SYLF domain-containing protein